MRTALMTPPRVKRKWHVTLEETVVHNFTIEVDEDEDPSEVAEHLWVQVSSLDQLEDHGSFIVDRRIDDVQPV